MHAVMSGKTTRVVLDTTRGRYSWFDADSALYRERPLPSGVLLRTTAHRQTVLFSPRGTSNLYSTTWLAADNDHTARWHRLRVSPTGTIELQ